MAECASETINTNGLTDLERKQREIDREPFRNFKISDTKILDTVEHRTLCGICNKSRKYFCYSCCLPVIDKTYIPQLPIQIDIIKHAREIDGKSTAIHAAILAPENVTVSIYPDIPIILNKEETVLIFPSETAISVEDFFTKQKEVYNTYTKTKKTAFPIKRAIFIDSTWHQTKTICKDKRLNGICCVILKSRISQFWRYQKKSPRWYLATIEAIHQFLVELHTCAFGIIEGYTNTNIPILNQIQELKECSEMDQRYNGQYDDLLYFFKYMYEKIHSIYDHDRLWAYKRPLL